MGLNKDALKRILKKIVAPQPMKGHGFLEVLGLIVSRPKVVE